MIDLALLVFLSTKGLLRSRVTTIVLVIAVAAGVGLQVPNTANLMGYTAEMFDEATTRGFGNVRVEDPRKPLMSDGDALAAELASVPGVRAAVPILTLPGAAGRGGREEVCEVEGVDPKRAFEPYRVRSGEDLAPDDEGVLVGTLLAARLGVHVGDAIDLRVLLPAPDLGPELAADEGEEPQMVSYAPRVRGIAAGTFGGDEAVIMARPLLARALAKPRGATRVLLYTGSRVEGVSSATHAGPREAAALAAEVSRRHPELRAVTWMDDHPYADSAIRANEVLGVVSHTMVVVAVTIPIASLLYVTVLNRRREIAILAALGYTRLDVFFAFLVQAFVVGLLGVVLGCALGWGALAWFDAHPIFASEEFSVRPVVTSASFYEPIVVVLVATVVAAAFPALRASRVDPARVLRGPT